MSGELNWGDIKASGGGATPFLKLDAGVNQIRVVGNPYKVDLHWEKKSDGATVRIVCPGAGCPICKAGHSPMLRYQILGLNRKNGKVEILEGGPRIFNAIKEYAQDPDYGDPRLYDLKIKKEGSGRETKYTVLAAPKKSPLSAEEQSLVESAKSLSDINKAKTPDEIMALDLELFADGLGGGGNSGWDESPKSPEKAASKDMDINDDEWENV